MTEPIDQPTVRLTAEQRRAIDAVGTPLTLVDEHDGEAYVLLAVEFIPDPELGGFTARVPGIPAYGEGGTERAAGRDLLDALTMILDGDRTRSPTRWRPDVEGIRWKCAPGIGPTECRLQGSEAGSS